MTVIETVILPASPDRCWRLLVAEQGALRLTPGLAQGSEGRGTMRMLVGGRSVSYRGYARTHVEEEGRHVTWTLSGKEMRGTGRAHAEIRARFHGQPEGGTALRLTVLVDGRGKLAEFNEEEIRQAVLTAIGRFKRSVGHELSLRPGRAAATSSEPAPPLQRAAEASFPVSRIEIIPPQNGSGRSWVVPAAISAGAMVGAGVLLALRRRHGR